MCPQRIIFNETPEERRQRELYTASKFLAAIFIMLAAIGAAFWLSQNELLVAVSSHLRRYILVACLAGAAVLLSIWSLFLGARKRENKTQAGILAGQFILYGTAFLVLIHGISSDAINNGGPTLTDVSVKPNSMVEVKFTVRAEGVKAGETILAEVEENKNSDDNRLLYRAVLHPNNKGDVDERVSVAFKFSNSVQLTIRARPDHVPAGGLACEPSQTPEKVSCATVMIPPR